VATICLVTRPGRRPTADGPDPRAGGYSGTRARSCSQAFAELSDGARQSPRGESEPPAETFGPFGIAERLNWAKAKKRRQK
jgi:hypothetical protein